MTIPVRGEAAAGQVETFFRHRLVYEVGRLHRKTGKLNG